MSNIDTTDPPPSEHLTLREVTARLGTRAQTPDDRNEQVGAVVEV